MNQINAICEGKQMDQYNEKKSLIRPDEFYIGSSSNQEICINGMIGKIHVKGNSLFLDGFTNVLLNDIPLQTESIRINIGDSLRINNYLIVFYEKYIRVTGNMRGFSSTLIEVEYEVEPFDGFPYYKRSPRIIRNLEKKEIIIENPKKLYNFGLYESKELFILIMISIMYVIAVVAIRANSYTYDNVSGSRLIDIYSVLLIIIGIAIFVFGYLIRRKRRIQARYRRYLFEKLKEIEKAYQDEKNIYSYNYPNNTQIATLVQNYSPRIYERNINDDDFLSVTIGTVASESDIKITSSADEEIVMDVHAIELWKKYKTIEKPLVVDLKKAHLGLVGEREVVHEQIKSIVLQLTFFHSYNDLEIVAIYDEKFDDDFQWMRWYPHFKIHTINCTGLVNSERKRDLILGSLYQMLAERKKTDRGDDMRIRHLPHIVFVIDEPKWVMDHPIVRYLGKDAINIGITVIYTAYYRANLPEYIGTAVEYMNSDEGTLLIEGGSERSLQISLPRMDGIDLEWTARDLGALVHDQRVGIRAPKTITFFEMYGADSPKQLNIEERWRVNSTAKSIAVPIGDRGNNDFVYLNAHEKAHGPHGLIAGMVGSGKSELIQSYILSLAVNFHPYEVAFLLIDCKGGGMARQFKDLPHLLGTITNLDGTQSMRMIASIKSELMRRQDILNSYSVNHINDYNKKFRSGEAREPLPHLFVICDEFAELKKEQPDFMKQLVSIARVGRSLGVHLVLSTQVPTGAVDEQIWSTSKFRIALKVKNESDSQEILKTPDAANITHIGRAYLQVGNNDIYEFFQSAWSGAPYSSEEGTEMVDDRVYLINQLGQGELINQDLSNQGGGIELLTTQLSATVDYIYNYYKSLDIVRVKKPWLPPLPEQIISPQKFDQKPAVHMNLAVPVGIVDIPEKQSQEEYVHDFSEDGNLLYVASPGYGKTIFLTTVAITLAMKNSVDDLNFYILDFGNYGLIPLRKLHHVADYISMDDTERLNKLVGILQREMELRKRLLADATNQGFGVYNLFTAKKMKAIVILVDNFDAVRELGYEMDDFFQRMTRDGSVLGIYFVACVTRSNAMKYGTYNNFKNKICGYLFDESDVSIVVGRSEYKQSDIRGRTLVEYNRAVSVMQVYTMADCKDEVMYSKEISAKIQEINAVYPDKVAPRIPVLPETLLSNMLSQFHGPKKDIYVGLDKETVELCGFNRENSPFVIVGERKRGKTNVLRLILSQIIGKGKIYLFDSKAMDLFSYKGNAGVDYVEMARQAAFYDELKVIVEERKSELQKKLTTNPGANPKDVVSGMEPVYLISDDWDDFVEGTKAKQTVLAPLLEEAVNVGVCIILTVNANRFKGFDPLTKFAKNTTNGLMVSGQGMTNIFPFTSLKDLPEMKDALLFNNGIYVRVRVPLAV